MIALITPLLDRVEAQTLLGLGVALLGGVAFCLAVYRALARVWAPREEDTV